MKTYVSAQKYYVETLSGILPCCINWTLPIGIVQLHVCIVHRYVLYASYCTYYYSDAYYSFFVYFYLICYRFVCR